MHTSCFCSSNRWISRNRYCEHISKWGSDSRRYRKKRNSSVKHFYLLEASTKRYENNRTRIFCSFSVHASSARRIPWHVFDSLASSSKSSFAVVGSQDLPSKCLASSWKAQGRGTCARDWCIEFYWASHQGIIDQHRYTSGSKPGGISPSLLSTRIERILRLARNLFARLLVAWVRGSPLASCNS